jgi:methylglutaconyl-CoA hydratase
MPCRTVELHIDDRGVATVTLSRADKHNALNPDLIDDLHTTVDGLRANDAVRVVVVTGAGQSFCAGGDLNWMKAQGNATREERMTEARRLAGLLGALNTLPKPVIARVNGNALGGGFGIMCVCDHVIIAEDAAFGLTETRLGLIPATIGPYVLARLGIGTARRVFLSGEVMRGADAVSLGLAEASTPLDELDATVETVVARYLAVSPGAVAMSKNLLLDLASGVDAGMVDTSVEYLADCWESDHAKAGIQAFLAKEKAPWRA